MIGPGSRRIIANTLYRGAADVGSKLITVALFVAIARTLGDSSFGLFVLGLSIGALLTVFAGFGQDAVLARQIARDRDYVHHGFPNTFAIKLLLSLPVLGAAAAVTEALGTDGTTQAVILLMGGTLLAEQLSATCFAVFQGFERLVYIPVVVIGQRVVTAAAGFPALALGADVVGVAAIFLGGAVLALLLAVVLVVRRVVRIRPRVAPGSWWSLAVVAFPVGLALVFQIVIFRADATLLAVFEPSSVVGDYGAAYRIFEATQFLGWAVAGAVFPVLARLTVATTPSVGLVFDRALKLVVAATLPVAVGAVVLAEPAIDLLFGGQYAEAGPALALLGPAIVLYGLAHVAGALLIARDRSGSVAAVYGVAAALNVAALLALIPVFSLNGAAAVATGTLVLATAALLALAARATGGISWARVLAGPAAGSVLVAAACLLLRDQVLGAIAVAGVLYAAVLVTFERRVYPDDAGAIRDFLRRSEPVA